MTKNLKFCSAITLVFILFTSVIPLQDYSNEFTTEDKEPVSMKANGMNGFHSSSPIVIVDEVNITFDNESVPYRWFSTESTADSLYINVSANTSSGSNYWINGGLTAYTAFDRCYTGAFYPSQGLSAVCDNPTEDPTILFSIDFASNDFSPSLTSNILQGNFTLTVSVADKMEVAPPLIAQYPYPDGDINADSTGNIFPSVDLVNGQPAKTVNGIFEDLSDQDFMLFNTSLKSTHRLNITTKQDLIFSDDWHPSGFSSYGLTTSSLDCEVSDNTGFRSVASFLNTPSELTPVGSSFYFSAYDGEYGRELWKSDGTLSGTSIFTDIRSGSGSSSPADFIAIGNTLYFTADNGDNGRELWRTDGTISGTILLKDINIGGGSSYVSSLTAVGSTVYFSAYDQSNGVELWKTDGTELGTMMVNDIRSGSGSSSPSNFAVLGDLLFFRAEDANYGSELWKSDGTASGTVMVKDINPSYNNGNPNELTVAGSTLYFRANDGSNGQELWMSNGTDSGTMMVKDIWSGYNSGYPTGITSFGQSVVFQAQNDYSNRELWISDGTFSGTLMVRDINTFSDSSPSNFVEFNGHIYFSADNGTNGSELWKTDGTFSGTVMLKDIYNGYSSGSPSNFAVAGGMLYFRANDGISGSELWMTDGTEAGTKLAKDVTSGSYNSNPSSMIEMGTTLYFTTTYGIYAMDAAPAGQVFEKYFDCFINDPTLAYSGTSVDSFGISLSLSSYSSVSTPVTWSFTYRFEQLLPFEDPVRGDSDPTKVVVLDPSSEFTGRFNFMGDADRYSIPVTHGTVQVIDVEVDQNATITFPSGECGRDGESGVLSPYSIGLGGSTQFLCETKSIADEIIFTVQHSVGSSSYMALLNTYPAYTFEFSTVQISRNNSERLDVLPLEKGLVDAPMRGEIPSLNLTDSSNGTFVHWSDQTDTYKILLSPDQSVQIDLRSNCAKFLEVNMNINKESYIQTVTLSHGDTGSYLRTVLPDGAEAFDVPIVRISSPSNVVTDVELKDICEYRIQTSPVSVDSVAPYTIPYTGRMSTSGFIINDFSSYVPANTVFGNHRLLVPLDIPATSDGYIQANQASNQPVFLGLSGTDSHPSEENTVVIGQHIDFGTSRVQWNQLGLYGLDGSALTVTYTEQPISRYTKENSELFSFMNGALGASYDEGWDRVDTFTFNTSLDGLLPGNNEHASVRMTSLSNDLKAKIGTFSSSNTISQLYCNLESSQVPVYLIEGGGTYSLEVDRTSGICPSISFNAPSIVTESSTFITSYSSSSGSDLNVEIFNEQLESVFVSNNTNTTQSVTLPDSMKEGQYRILLMGVNGIAYAERPLEVTTQPTILAFETAQILDIGDDPQVQIRVLMPHTGEPLDWTFTNITTATVSLDGTIFEQTLDSEFTGFGAKVVTIDDLPQTMPGSLIQVEGELIVNGNVTNVSLFWKKAFYTPVISCESEIIPDTRLPENDVLCLVSVKKNAHRSYVGFSYPTTEYQLEGTFDIYDQDFAIVQQIEFTHDIYSPSTPVRINSILLGNGTYFVKLNTSTAVGVFTEEYVETFEIGQIAFSEAEEESIGSFDLNLISVRETAAAGDEILLAWDVEGELANYFRVDIFSFDENGSTLVDSYSIINDELRQGQFKVQLPTNANTYLDHTVTVYAYSEYGSLTSDSVYVEGISPDEYLDVNINPDRPVIGSEISVQLMLSEDDKWMSWNWELRRTSSSSSELITSGDGFVADNRGTFKFDLPINQYTSPPYLHILVESEDGVLFSEKIRIEPVPLRSVNIVMDSELVLGESHEVEWELSGKYLNTVDKIERIEFTVLTMDYETYHEEVYFVNSLSGEFESSIPSTLNPGSHRVEIEFTFSDGETYEHSQIVTVLSSPQGLNAFGLNIPPLAMGLDTILVLLLIAHAVFLHRRNPRSEAESEKYESMDFEEEIFNDVEDEPIQLQQENSAVVATDSEAQPASQMETYPMYQEYPEGSGRNWVRNSEYEEWVLIEQNDFSNMVDEVL